MNLEELMQNEEFTAKLEKARDLDEVLAMIRERGIEITTEEITSAYKKLNDGELDENALEDVAGGSIFTAAVAAGAAALARWIKKHPGILPSPSPIRPRW